MVTSLSHASRSNILVEEGLNKHPRGGGGGNAPAPQHPGGGGGGNPGAGAPQQRSPELQREYEEIVREQKRKKDEQERARAYEKEVKEAHDFNVSRNDFQKFVQDNRNARFFPSNENNIQWLKLTQDKFEPEARMFFQREVIVVPHQMLNQLVSYPAVAPSMGRMVMDYAITVSQIGGEFLSGAYHGSVHGINGQLITAQQVAEAIFRDPRILVNMSKYVVHTLAHPERMTASIKEACEHYYNIARFGTPSDIGFVTGKFVTEAIMTAALLETPILKGSMLHIKDMALKGGNGGSLASNIALGLSQHGHEGVKKSIQIDRETHGAIRGLDRRYIITGVEDAALANDRFREWRHPYWPFTKVIHFTPNEEAHFVRVHTDKNRVGGWVMRRDSLRGLNPVEIQVKFALPRHLLLLQK